MLNSEACSRYGIGTPIETFSRAPIYLVLIYVVVLTSHQGMCFDTIHEFVASRETMDYSVSRHSLTRLQVNAIRTLSRKGQERNPAGGY